MFNQSHILLVSEFQDDLSKYSYVWMYQFGNKSILAVLNRYLSFLFNYFDENQHWITCWSLFNKAISQSKRKTIYQNYNKITDDNLIKNCPQKTSYTSQKYLLVLLFFNIKNLVKIKLSCFQNIWQLLSDTEIWNNRNGYKYIFLEVLH